MPYAPFDDRDGVIWMDGEYIAWREAKIHVLTHSLHYGGAVFEGIRAYNGAIFKLAEHSNRLIESARIVGYKLPYSLEELNQATIDCFNKSGFKDAYLRPFAWRGAQEMGIGAKNCKIHMAIAAWEWPNYFPKELVENGITLKTCCWRRPPPECAPVHAKTSGLYTISTLSKHQAEAAGYHDALMLDYQGRVSECSGANFFVVKDKKITTPRPDCFLNGITKQTVMKLATGLGYSVEEKIVMPEDALKADELFVTGTAYEVLPIAKLDDTKFKAGPVTQKLRQAYLEHAGAL